MPQEDFDKWVTKEKTKIIEASSNLLPDINPGQGLEFLRGSSINIIPTETPEQEKKEKEWSQIVITRGGTTGIHERKLYINVDDLTNSLKRACVTEDGALLFVHASVDTTRPLTMQKDQFWWDNGKFNEIKNKFSDFSKVIRGYDHSNSGIVLNKDYIASIDGGCGRSGKLHAVCFTPDGLKHDEIMSR